MIPDYVHCLPHQHTGNEQKRPAIYKQAFENLNKNVVSTDQEEYFQHLKSFLRLIEPIIEDLERKGFI